VDGIFLRSSEKEFGGMADDFEDRLIGIFINGDDDLCNKKTSEVSVY
jgi:hypothetical protein